MSDGEWYWCLDHSEVESGPEACAADRRLGPFQTREAAAGWRERFESRNEAWDRSDRDWEEGEPSG